METAESYHFHNFPLFIAGKDVWILKFDLNQEGSLSEHQKVTNKPHHFMAFVISNK